MSPISLPRSAGTTKSSRRSNNASAGWWMPSLCAAAVPARCLPTLSRISGAYRTLSEDLRSRIENARSAEHLQRAVERHQAGLDRELGVALADGLAKFRQRLAVGLGLGRRVGDARHTIGDPCRTAIAVIDRDQLGDMVQL